MKFAFLALSVLGLAQVAQAAAPEILWNCQEFKKPTDGYRLIIYRQDGKITAQVGQDQHGIVKQLASWSVRKDGPRPGKPLQVFTDRKGGGSSFSFSIATQNWGALQAILPDGTDVRAAMTCQKDQ